MTTPGNLEVALRIYWDDMDLCRDAKAYWSLLHVTICLPDICAALQSDDGRTNGKLYIAWCDQFLPDTLLSGSERYQMRCNVLHQGRAKIEPPGRYTGFSFAQPTQTGEIDHRRVEGTTLILDVGRLSSEYRHGVEGWTRYLKTKPTSPDARNVVSNLPSLVRVRQFRLPSRPGALFGHTDIFRSS